MLQNPLSFYRFYTLIHSLVYIALINYKSMVNVLIWNWVITFNAIRRRKENNPQIIRLYGVILHECCFWVIEKQLIFQCSLQAAVSIKSFSLRVSNNLKRSHWFKYSIWIWWRNSSWWIMWFCPKKWIMGRRWMGWRIALGWQGCKFTSGNTFKNSSELLLTNRLLNVVRIYIKVRKSLEKYKTVDWPSSLIYHTIFGVVHVIHFHLMAEKYHGYALDWNSRESVYREFKKNLHNF